MSVWDDHPTLTDEAKRLWSEGVSASAIAQRLGHGISRNAVIGRMHRIGCPKHEDPGWVNRQLALKRRKAKPKPNFARRGPPMLPTPIPAPQADDIVRVTFAQLEDHHCRFIPGEPKDGYCGLEKVPGTSYCAGHLHRCTGTPVVRTFSPMSAQRRLIGSLRGVAKLNKLTVDDVTGARLHPVDIRDLETIT